MSNMEEINVYKRQFDKRAVELLTAQRNVYKIAKRINFINFCISILVPFILSILIFFYDELDIVWIKLIFGVVIFFSSIGLGNICKNIKNKAALIQRVYDLYVVGLGKEITNFEMENIVNKYCDKFNNKKINIEYYQDYSKLSYTMQQVNCLKENMRYDNDIRKAYKVSIYIFSIVLIVLIFVIEGIKNLRVREISSQICLCLPIFFYLFREINSINQDIYSKNNMKSNLNIIDKSFQNTNIKIDINKMLNEAQDDLNEYRAKAVLIPEMFYKIYDKLTIKTQKNIAKRINNNTQNR